MPLLEISGLDVTFGAVANRVRAVRGVSLAVEQGESYGIVGESGSGKSTILRAICGLARVSGGTIRLDGTPLETPRSPAFYRRVQMVFQDQIGRAHV